jgi:hypothetical protein
VHDELASVDPEEVGVPVVERRRDVRDIDRVSSLSNDPSPEGGGYSLPTNSTAATRIPKRPNALRQAP